MKIALYVPSWPPGRSPNGIVTYASHIVPALRGLGHEVFILTFAPGRTDDQHTVDLRQYGLKPSVLDRAAAKLAPNWSLFRFTSSAIARAVSALVLEHRIDILEIEESFGWSSAVSRANIVPVVVRLHGPCFLMGQFSQPINKAKIYSEGQGIRAATYVTSCCRETLRAVKTFYDLPLRKSTVIPNPMSAAPEKKIWHAERCTTGSLLYVGRFDKVKGGDVILRAFALLATRFPQLTLTFVGPDHGLKTNGKLLSLQQFVQQYIPENVRTRIDFRGQLSHSEVMALRLTHFVTIIAARHDIQGYAIMEAMSYGCPILATAVGGIPEVILDRRNGLLTVADDPEALAASCAILLENHGLAAELGHQAWVDCRASYRPENIAGQTLSVYNDAAQMANGSLHGD